MKTYDYNNRKINKIKSNIASKNLDYKPNIIAVKRFPTNKTDNKWGHIHFGENKVQEAYLKWKDQKKLNKNIKLHMFGNLQSNKERKLLKYSILFILSIILSLLKNYSFRC